MSGKWRIEELRQWTAKSLELAPLAGQSSGRVRDVPDVRTIRYYTTIGLIDRADEIRGRTAFYGPKHLRQLAERGFSRRSKSIRRATAGFAVRC